MFYYLLINLSNNQTNEKDLTYKVRVSYRMYPYLFHTTSRESKKSLFGTRHTVFLRICPDRYKGDIQGKRDTLIQNDHTLLIAGQFVENDTLFLCRSTTVRTEKCHETRIFFWNRTDKASISNRTTGLIVSKVTMKITYSKSRNTETIT